MKSEGEEAEKLSLQRMKTRRSSGKSSKRSDLPESVVAGVRGLFLNMVGDLGAEALNNQGKEAVFVFES